MTRLARTKQEVTKEALEKFVAEFPRPLVFDGMRYTEDVQMRGGVWKKPVAAVVEGKYFLIND